jgi:pyruvate-ferredoxin/flavodoxin oxidoreductase
MGANQAKLAVESRAYPLFRYDPDAGSTPAECFDLEGNPDMEEEWPTYELEYVDAGRKKTMQVPMTFADFAVTEARFRKHFRTAPPDTWNENMVPLIEFLKMDSDEREGKFPYIWAVDRKQQLIRVLVAKPLVESTEERLDFWTMLKSLAGLDREAGETPDEMESRVRGELVGNLARRLMELAGGGGGAQLETLALPSATGEAASASASASAPSGTGDYMAPWIDTERCTTCDECIKISKKIFAYNDKKKAVIVDPQGGPYRDIVKAAERCTAQVIHPGLPADRSEKDIDKWIERGKKFN